MSARYSFGATFGRGVYGTLSEKYPPLQLSPAYAAKYRAEAAAHARVEAWKDDPSMWDHLLDIEVPCG